MGFTYILINLLMVESYTSLKLRCKSKIIHIFIHPLVKYLLHRRAQEFRMECAMKKIGLIRVQRNFYVLKQTDDQTSASCAHVYDLFYHKYS